MVGPCQRLIGVEPPRLMCLTSPAVLTYPQVLVSALGLMVSFSVPCQGWWVLVGWALADGGVMAAAHRCPITCIDVPVVSHGDGMPPCVSSVST